MGTLSDAAGSQFVMRMDMLGDVAGSRFGDMAGSWLSVADGYVCLVMRLDPGLVMWMDTLGDMAESRFGDADGYAQRWNTA
ncbi:hypothetical protein chiPu_0018574 [Chiloscyllium punctatum]|uniref:Uncharacterized protein n=1 Tax=Chiloscyllium punctatum TaxID=137246 RepID=A0A401RNW8_CHIPU|nr:hypothetical protein [Chiloscyllium punctatum]